MPIYLLTTTLTPEINGAAVVNQRLVEAANGAAALKHVTGDTITCGIADPHDILRLGKAGVEIEAAK